MALFGRRKKTESQGMQTDLASLANTGADAMAVWGSGDDFDLRAMVDEYFSIDLLYSVQQLRDVMGVSADEFYVGVMLDEQWDGQDEAARRSRLEQDAAYANRFSEMDNDDAPPEMIKMLESINLKVQVLAIGCDALYKTDYVQRLYDDPMQFGVYGPTTSERR